MGPDIDNRRFATHVARAGLYWAVLLVSANSSAQFVQQGPKLIGTGPLNNAEQGVSVGLSADGNTAIVGGPSFVGAAWIYTRNAGVWTQQGPQLVGSGAVGFSGQGWSAAMSGDGTTAVVGGGNDNSDAGAAWVFVRGGGVWTQQGAKLVGTDAATPSSQGASVALSADGNTAIVGGYDENNLHGAAWVYTRAGGVWTQQGTKLVGTGAVGNASQGTSVALSATIVGGRYDNNHGGAAWVFVANTIVVAAMPVPSLDATGLALTGTIEKVTFKLGPTQLSAEDEAKVRKAIASARD